MALRTASIIVILGMSVPCFLALAAHVRRHFGIDALKNVAHRGAAAGVQRIMTDAASLNVPLVVDVGRGANWDEAH